MINRHFRPLVIAAVAAIALVTLNTTVSAQLIDKCACKYITVRVNDLCTKKIDVCFLSATSDRCFTFESGNKYQIECEDLMDIAIVDCHNQKQLIDPARGCIGALPVTDFCCITACLTKLDDGCLLLDITPSPILSCRCR